jgi:hypothetical protein
MLGRSLVIAVACVVFANQLSAQTPPAQETEQRLKTLETKMDRVLNLLSNRADATPSAAPDAASAAIEEARIKVRAVLAAQVREFEPMRHTPNTGGLLAERIGKLESLRQDSRIKLQEMADQLVRIETAYKAGGPEKGNAAAMRIIRAMGLKPSLEINNFDDALLQLTLAKRELLQTLGPNNPRVKEIEDRIAELVRLVGRARTDEKTVKSDEAKSYMEDMRQQIDSATTKIETLTNIIEQEKAKAREVNAIEVKRDRLQAEIDRLRHMLAGLDGILQSEPGPRPR